MSDTDGSAKAKRRSKRFLSPSQKYEIWLRLVRQEVSVAEAAAAEQVDRSTIMRIRTVAKEGALAALAASKPGVGAKERDYELEQAKAEVARLSEACKELAVRLTFGLRIHCESTSPWLWLAPNCCQMRAVVLPRPPAQPLPSVDPALDLAVLLDPSLASVLPAFDSAPSEGLGDLADLPIADHLLRDQYNTSADSPGRTSS